MMTGRECLLNVLDRRPVDRIVWTTLADRVTRSAMPEPERSMTCLEFYRRIGSDVLQFGNFDLPKDLRVPMPSRLVQPEVERESVSGDDGVATTTTRTPWGTLTATSRRGHPIRHPVTTLADVRVLTAMWEHAGVEETDGMEEVFARTEAALGDAGVYLPTTTPSPVQQLIELDMGAEAFYALLAEHPAEVERLLAAMHERRCQEYEILARRTPAPAIIPVENTSATLISPALYRRLSLPQIRDYADIAHRRGKKLILHMCGLLRHLLPVIRETGFDGVNALTPPTFGDITFAEALDLMGEDFIILGGIFDSGVFQRPGVAADEIDRALDALYTPRIRRAHVALWLPADGQPAPIEPFLAVSEWMEKNGRM